MTAVFDIWGCVGRQERISRSRPPAARPTYALLRQAIFGLCMGIVSIPDRV